MNQVGRRRGAVGLRCQSAPHRVDSRLCRTSPWPGSLRAAYFLHEMRDEPRPIAAARHTGRFHHGGRKEGVESILIQSEGLSIVAEGLLTLLPRHGRLVRPGSCRDTRRRSTKRGSLTFISWSRQRCFVLTGIHERINLGTHVCATRSTRKSARDKQRGPGGESFYSYRPRYCVCSVLPATLTSPNVASGDVLAIQSR